MPTASALLLSPRDRRAPAEEQGVGVESLGGWQSRDPPPRGYLPRGQARSWWHPDLREGTPSWQEGRQGSGCARWHTEALHEMYTWKPGVGQRQWLMVLGAPEVLGTLEVLGTPEEGAPSPQEPPLKQRVALRVQGTEQHGAVMLRQHRGQPGVCSGEVLGGGWGCGNGGLPTLGGSGGPSPLPPAPPWLGAPRR